jgi:hypothetical protein
MHWALPEDVPGDGVAAQAASQSAAAPRTAHAFTAVTGEWAGAMPHHPPLVRSSAACQVPAYRV